MEAESEGHTVREGGQSRILKALQAMGKRLDLILSGSGSHWKVLIRRRT